MNKYGVWIIVAVLAGVLATVATIAPGVDAGKIAALSGIAVAVATLLLAIVTAAATEETRLQARLAQRALNRPSIIPLMVPNITVFIADTPIDIRIGNRGRGTAFNISGMLTRPRSADGTVRAHLATILSTSLQVDQEEILHFQIADAALPPNVQIGSTNLEVPTGKLFARLTVTYSDIFGTLYGSIFDLDQSATWVPVAAHEDIIRGAKDVAVV